MAARKPIPDATQTAVLAASRRRCCLCAALHKDFEVKQGQLAHLDQDSSNSQFDNLAFLCLAHHDQYDSKTSQSKGFTLSEVKAHRDLLYRGFADWDDPSKPGSRTGSVQLKEFEFLDSKLQLLYRARLPIFRLLDHPDGDNQPMDWAIDDPLHNADRCFETLGHRSLAGKALPTECPRCKRPIYDAGGVFTDLHGPDFTVRYYLSDLKRAVFREIRRLRNLGTALEGRVESSDIIYPTMIRGW